MSFMKLGESEIQLLVALRTISRVEAKDCLVGDKTISFMVNEGQMGKAIGKNGINIKKLEEAFKKKIEMVEFKSAPDLFLAGAFPRIRFGGFEVYQDGKNHKVLVARTDGENRRKLLSFGGRFRRVKTFLERHFEIVDVKV